MSERPYVDPDGAKILGIEYLSKKIDIESLKVIMQSGIVIKDLSKML